MTQSPELMSMATWNSSGFYVLTALLIRVKCNTGYYMTEILKRIKTGGRSREPAAPEK
jgi:hypothetical protein